MKNDSDTDEDYENVPQGLSPRTQIELEREDSSRKYETLSRYQPSTIDGASGDEDILVRNDREASNLTPSSNGIENPVITLSPETHGDTLSNYSYDRDIYLTVMGNPHCMTKTEHDEVDLYDDVSGKEVTDGNIQTKCEINHNSHGPRARLSTGEVVRYVDGTKIFRQVQSEPYKEMASYCSQSSQQEVTKKVVIPRILLFFLVLALIVSITMLVIMALHLRGVVKGIDDKTNDFHNLKIEVDRLSAAVAKLQQSQKT